MKDCKKCQNFYDSGKEYHCYALRTVCAAVENPNLGQSLGGCDFIEIEEVEDELQS